MLFELINTNPKVDWTVDISTLGPVYPFFGFEMPMVIIGLVLWIAWHVVQVRQENREWQDDLRTYADKDLPKYGEEH